MKQNLTKFFNLIKQDKQAKTLTIIGILLIFIFTLGYSLSAFTGNKNSNVANIKVNNLSFNLTTNSGESDDRILYLQAGKTEQFNIILTNLNKLDVKYELIYDVCNDSNCTSITKDKPNDLLVFKENENTEINGNISTNKFKRITILTNNKSTNDYYIKLGLNAGYSWNELALTNQINEVISLDKDIDIIAYVDGVEVKDLPSTCFYEATSTAYKNNAELTDSNVSFTCNYATGEWKLKINKLKNIPDKLIVNFENKGISAVEYITTLQEKDAENIHGLYIDPTSDKNIRYTGSNPKNYVEFGNDGELWRIIGIFNTTDSSGATSKKLKLVRDEGIGIFSWDTTDNDNYGYNDWSSADLMQELNGDYLNYNLLENTYWYNSYWDNTNQKPMLRKSGTFDYKLTIKEKYQNYISDNLWNLGGYDYNNPNTYPYGLPVSDFYLAERGTKVYTGMKTTWTGKVGLIYPSDYGYASADSNCRENLRSGIVYNTQTGEYDYTNAKCKNDNFLQKEYFYRTITPCFSYSSNVFYVGGEGYSLYYAAYDISNVHPSIYLMSNVEFVSGTGEKDNPYKFI